jgi:hypothetical protein
MGSITDHDYVGFSIFEAASYPLGIVERQEVFIRAESNKKDGQLILQ